MQYFSSFLDRTKRLLRRNENSKTEKESKQESKQESTQQTRKILGIGNHYVAVMPPFKCQGESEYDYKKIGIITNNKRTVEKEYENNKVINAINNYDRYFIVSNENYCKCDTRNDTLEFSNNKWNEIIEIINGNVATKKNNKIIYRPRLNGVFVSNSDMLSRLNDLEMEINAKIESQPLLKLYDDASSDEKKRKNRKVIEYKENEFEKFLSNQFALTVDTTEKVYLYQLKMPYGGIDFLSYLDKNKSKRNIISILKLLINVFEGIKELIERKLIHQDIFGNILINNGKAKIIDFETLITFDELYEIYKINSNIINEMYEDVKRKQKQLPLELSEFIKTNNEIEDIEELDPKIFKLIIDNTKIKNDRIDMYFIGLLLKYINKNYLKLENTSSLSLSSRKTAGASARSEDSSKELQKKYLKICRDLLNCKSNIYEIISDINKLI